MSFTPAIPLTGFLGWRVFNQTEVRQREIFTNDATTFRNVDYFKENISSAATAADLVTDRRLLTVALGAFGLSDEIDKKALIRRILEEGTEDSNAFANRINDQRWRDFSERFGYGNFAGPRILLSAFREEIATQYVDRTFEERVGEVDTDIRLAMNFRREIERIAENSSPDRVKWLQIMGQRPLRTVMETALGLPTSIGSVDIDQQRDIFMRKAEAIFGSNAPSIFSDPEAVENALQQFFLRKEIENGPSASTPGMAALSILSAPPSGGAQTINLILSNARSRG